MYSLYQDPLESILDIDIIEDDTFFSTSKLFDIDSPWPEFSMKRIDAEILPFPSLFVEPKSITFETLTYGTSPMLSDASSPFSDAWSLPSASTPSPTINPLDIYLANPSPSPSPFPSPSPSPSPSHMHAVNSRTSIKIFDLIHTNPLGLPAASPSATPAFKEESLPPRDGNIESKEEEEENSVSMDNDAAIQKALADFERERRSSRSAKKRLLSFDDDDEEESDEAYIPSPSPSSSKRRKPNGHRSVSPHHATPSSGFPVPLRARSIPLVGKMYYCPWPRCSFHSERPSDVERHCQSVHQKVKFSCDVCGKKLTRKDAIKRHQTQGTACAKALRKRDKYL